MTYLAITLGVVCLYLAWQVHKAQHTLQQERDDQNLERIELLRKFHHERQGLLNRIQMPEVGVSQALAEEADGVSRHISADGSPYEDQEWDDHVLEGLRQRGIELDG